MKYDMHCHTWYSPCSLLSPPVFLKFISKEMDGIAITDHDTLKGYEVLKKINKKKDFEIVKGVEKTTDNGHVLAYYVNYVPKTNDFFEVMDSFKSQGAIIATAHPYSYVKRHKFRLAEKEIRRFDAVECRNATMSEKQNKKAVALANKHNLAKIAGSDSHFVSEVGMCYTIFEGDLREAIRKRKTKVGGKLKYFVFNQVASAVLSKFRNPLKDANH
ncbi:PHP domain-containing protein [Candidatus Woesearchaeota archaeon]|nr:PHP domain-containing protein [Candidatus Woesearchaeota archaeon]